MKAYSHIGFPAAPSIGGRSYFLWHDHSKQSYLTTSNNCSIRVILWFTVGRSCCLLTGVYLFFVIFLGKHHIFLLKVDCIQGNRGVGNLIY